MKTSQISSGTVYVTSRSSYPEMFIVLSTDQFDVTESRRTGHETIRRVEPGTMKRSAATRGVLVAKLTTSRYRHGPEEVAKLIEFERSINALTITLISADPAVTETTNFKTTEKFTLASGATEDFTFEVVTPQQVASTLIDYEASLVEAERHTALRAAKARETAAATARQVDEIKVLLGLPADDKTSIRTNGGNGLHLTTTELLALLLNARA
jgi:hypothetical protein